MLELTDAGSGHPQLGLGPDGGITGSQELLGQLVDPILETLDLTPMIGRTRHTRRTS